MEFYNERRGLLVRAGHRNAVASGGGAPRPERRSRAISIASREKEAEFVRVGRARWGTRRQRVGPLPDREGRRARITWCWSGGMRCSQSALKSRGEPRVSL